MKEILNAFVQQWLAALKKQPHIIMAFAAVIACGALGWIKADEYMALFLREVAKNQAKDEQLVRTAEDKVRILEEQHKTDAKLREYLENKISEQNAENRNGSR